MVMGIVVALPIALVSFESLGGALVKASPPETVVLLERSEVRRRREGRHDCILRLMGDD